MKYQIYYIKNKMKQKLQEIYEEIKESINYNSVDFDTFYKKHLNNVILNSNINNLDYYSRAILLMAGYFDGTCESYLTAIREKIEPGEWNEKITIELNENFKNGYIFVELTKVEKSKIAIALANIDTNNMVDLTLYPILSNSV